MGFYKTHYLKKKYSEVTIFSPYSSIKLKENVKKAKEIYTGEIFQKLDSDKIEKYDMILDGLFGAGLSRPLLEEICQIIHWIKQRKKYVISIDLSSGISGDTGEVVGEFSFESNETITFFNKKIGHESFPEKEK